MCQWVGQWVGKYEIFCKKQEGLYIFLMGPRSARRALGRRVRRAPEGLVSLNHWSIENEAGLTKIQDGPLVCTIAVLSIVNVTMQSEVHNLN